MSYFVQVLYLHWVCKQLPHQVFTTWIYTQYCLFIMQYKNISYLNFINIPKITFSMCNTTKYSIWILYIDPKLLFQYAIVKYFQIKPYIYTQIYFYNIQYYKTSILNLNVTWLLCNTTILFIHLNVIYIIYFLHI